MATSKGIVYTAVRLIYGLLLLTLGLNIFFRFLPMPAPPEAAQSFMAAIASAKFFFPLMGILEILAGLMLLINFAPALAVLLVFPLLVCALLYHLALDPGGILFAVVCFVSNLIIIFFNFGKYMPLLER